MIVDCPIKSAIYNPKSEIKTGLLAMAYSPTPLPGQYHWRWRA
jgi:hypothetical protein